MSAAYSRTLLRIAVAQVSQSLGWNAVQSTPMEMLTDVMERYIMELAQNTHRYAEQFGRTEPNLDDLGLVFQDVGVSIPELEDYVQHVDPLPFALDVPSFPVRKEAMLHFPKPNSRELMNREEHIHEHLPPMHPEWDDEIIQPTVSAVEQVQAAPPVTPTQSTVVPTEKRPATSPAEGGPPAKKLKSLPEEAGHSQYLMKSVIMSSSGSLVTDAPGTLPDARTPPPPTPHTPKTVATPFQNVDKDKALTEIPKIPKASVTCETVEEHTSIGGMKTDDITAIRAENIDKPATKSPRGGKSLTKASKLGTPAKSKSPKHGPKSPKVSPKVDKLSKSVMKQGKSGKSSPKTKTIKSAKLGKSPKVGSPKPGKSPKRQKDTSAPGKVINVANVLKSPRSPGRGHSPGRGRSPRKSAGSRLEELLVKKEAIPEVPEPKESEPIDMSIPAEPFSPGSDALDLSMPKVPFPTKGALKEPPPEFAMDPRFGSPLGAYPPTFETSEAKESRLASYDDAINTVLNKVKPVPKQDQATVPPVIKEEPQKVIVKPEEPAVPKASLPKSSPVPTKAEKKQKKERDITDSGTMKTASEINVVPKPPLTPVVTTPVDVSTKGDVYTFDEPPSQPPVEPYPSSVSTPLSVPKSEKKSKDKKGKKLMVKMPESASTPSGEESDASKDRGDRSKARESSYSPSGPKVILEQMTPDDIRRLSYSPEKKVAASPQFSMEAAPEVTDEKPHVQPIKLDISQPKITIKLPKDRDGKSEKEIKKEKKKKKNKDKDKVREKSKEKKDKNREKDRKKDKKDKEKKKEKRKESTVGGQGFPKLTLKFGGLNTATPTMSMASPDKSPPQQKEKLKLVIKPLSGETPTKSSSKPKPPPSPPPKSRTPTPPPPKEPSPPPSPAPPSLTSSSPPPTRSPSPSPSPRHESPIRTPSPTKPARDRSPSLVLSSPIQSPSRSPVHSPIHLLHRHSPLGSFSPTITFSPLPSPAPHFEVPLSRSPSPRPVAPPPAPPTPPPQPSPATKKKESKRSPAKKAAAAAAVIPSEEDEDEEDVTATEPRGSGDRMVITETLGTIKDENGETIWICPTCGKQDDGSPMIGCDKCDDWYHWPCVGIKKEPPENQDWYCPRCQVLLGKQEGRKKKATRGRPGRKKKKV